MSKDRFHIFEPAHPSILLEDYEIDPELIKLVPRELAVKYLLIPVSRAGSSLAVAMTDPWNEEAISNLEFLTGFKVDVAIAGESDLRKAIKRYYPGVADEDFPRANHRRLN